MPDPYSAHGILCACAVETHMDISQEPFCVRNNKKIAAHYSAHLVKHRAFYPYSKMELYCTIFQAIFSVVTVIIP